MEILSKKMYNKPERPIKIISRFLNNYFICVNRINIFRIVARAS